MSDLSRSHHFLHLSGHSVMNGRERSRVVTILLMLSPSFTSSTLRLDGSTLLLLRDGTERDGRCRSLIVLSPHSPHLARLSPSFGGGQGPAGANGGEYE